MSELPKLPAGWTRCTLGDIVETIRGVSYDKADARDAPAPGLVPILRANNIGEKLNFDDLVFVPESRVSDDQRLRVGDIVVAASSGSRSVVGKAAPLLVPWRGGFGAFCMVVRPSQSVNPRYVAHFMATREYRTRVSLLAAGVNINNLKRQHVAETPFPLAPRSEQDRIVAEIEKQFTRLDAGVAALERLQAHLRRYRAAVLKAACEGRLVEGGAQAETAAQYLSRHGVSGMPTSTIAGARPLPPGWVWTTIGHMKKHSMYGPRFSSDDYASDGRLVVRTSDINEAGKVNTATAPRLPLTDEEFSRYKVDRGDLLITRTGSLGTLAVFDDDVDAIPGAYLIHYRLRVPAITTRYVFTFLKSPDGQRQLVGGGAGVGRPNLNAPTIEKILIPLPPPAEQERILRAVDDGISRAENVERGVLATLTRAARLRASILRSAFEGRLVAPEKPARAPAA